MAIKQLTYYFTVEPKGIDCERFFAQINAASDYTLPGGHPITQARHAIWWHGKPCSDKRVWKNNGEFFGGIPKFHHTTPK